MPYDSFNSFRSDVRSETWPTFKVLLLVVIPIMFVLLLIGQCFSFAADAANVAQNEFNASALLEKYEWFKDAHASLDAKVANIKVYEQRFKQQEEFYGKDRTKWPRDVREQTAIWQSEVAGIIASYNNLASEYNSQMAKFNYRFTNVGQLPQGATVPLPREYVPYNTGDN